MGALLGLSAPKTPAKYSSIVAQLLASCEQSPFAAQFVYNLMGPIFYELTMMALPSEDQLQNQITKAAAAAAGTISTSTGVESGISPDLTGVNLATIVKFLCFVYMESTLQYESTEDVFETLTFCDQFEVAELQEYCTSSLASLAENVHRRGTQRNRLLGKRICDYLVLFLGGRIPFYFDEAELTLLHSVLIETLLDLCYAERSEFDIAQEGVLWVQRRLIKTPSSAIECPAILPLVVASRSVERMTMTTTTTMTKRSHIPQFVILVNLLVICSAGVNIFACLIGLIVSVVAIWTWVSSAIPCHIIRLMYVVVANPEPLEGIIAGQQPVSEIIHFETGS